LPAGAARSPNAVRVGFDFGGHVVVDHVLDPGDVQTARGKRRGDQHAARTRLEALDGLLAVPLLVVTVDGGGLHALRHEEIAEPITRALPLDEYHRAAGVGLEVLEKLSVAVVKPYLLDHLLDVLRRGA